MQARTVALAGIVIGLVAGATLAASAQTITYECVDSANGARLTVAIDPVRRTVNNLPAEISASHVAWVEKAPNTQSNPSNNDGAASAQANDLVSDKKNDLNRVSGTLTVRSADGHTRFNRCRKTTSPG